MSAIARWDMSTLEGLLNALENKVSHPTAGKEFVSLFESIADTYRSEGKVLPPTISAIIHSNSYRLDLTRQGSYFAFQNDRIPAMREAMSNVRLTIKKITEQRTTLTEGLPLVLRIELGEYGLSDEMHTDLKEKKAKILDEHSELLNSDKFNKIVTINRLIFRLGNFSNCSDLSTDIIEKRILPYFIKDLSTLSEISDRAIEEASRIHWLIMRLAKEETTELVGYHSAPSTHVAFQFAVRAIVQEVLKMPLPKNFYFLRAPGLYKYNGMDKRVYFTDVVAPSIESEDLKKLVSILISSDEIGGSSLYNRLSRIEKNKLVWHLYQTLFKPETIVTKAHLAAINRILNLDREKITLCQLKERLLVFNSAHKVIPPEDLLSPSVDDVSDQSFLTSINFTPIHYMDDGGESSINILFNNFDIAGGSEKAFGELRDLFQLAGIPRFEAHRIYNLALELFRDPVILQISERQSLVERSKWGSPLNEVAYLSKPFGAVIHKDELRQRLTCQRKGVKHKGKKSNNPPQIRLVMGTEKSLNPFWHLRMRAFRLNSYDPDEMRDKMITLQEAVSKLDFNPERRAAYATQLRKAWGFPSMRAKL